MSAALGGQVGMAIARYAPLLLAADGRTANEETRAENDGSERTVGNALHFRRWGDRLSYAKPQR
jgi:hypothetical protein